MTNKFKLLGTFFLFAFSALSSSTAFANTDRLLNDIQEKYAELNNFRAEFNQELYHRESQHNQEKSGVFFFKKPMLIRFESIEPDSEILIVNNEAIWNYIPYEELAYKYSRQLLDNTNNILSVLTGKTSFDDEFDVEQLEDKKQGGKIFHVLKLYPLEPTLDLTEADLVVDSRTKLIYSAKIYDFYGNTNYVTFSNYEIDTTIEKDTFEFIPPKGIDIEDHTSAESLQIEGLSN